MRSRLLKFAWRHRVRAQLIFMFYFFRQLREFWPAAAARVCAGALPESLLPGMSLSPDAGRRDWSTLKTVPSAWRFLQTSRLSIRARTRKSTLRRFHTRYMKARPLFRRGHAAPLAAIRKSTGWALRTYKKRARAVEI